MWNTATKDLSIHEIYVSDYTVIWDKLKDYFDEIYPDKYWDMEYEEVRGADDLVTIHIPATNYLDALADRSVLIEMLAKFDVWYSYAVHHTGDSILPVVTIVQKKYPQEQDDAQ